MEHVLKNALTWVAHIVSHLIIILNHVMVWTQRKSPTRKEKYLNPQDNSTYQNQEHPRRWSGLWSSSGVRRGYLGQHKGGRSCEYWRGGGGTYIYIWIRPYLRYLTRDIFFLEGHIPGDSSEGHHQTQFQYIPPIASNEDISCKSCSFFIYKISFPLCRTFHYLYTHTKSLHKPGGHDHSNINS